MFGNGTRQAAFYDDLNWVRELTNFDGKDKIASAFSYTDDKVGDVLTAHESGQHNLGKPDGQLYQYDALRRLTSVRSGSNSNKVTEFGYDKVGNRISVKTPPQNGFHITTCSYDWADQLTQFVRQNGNQVTSFVHDGNGNVVERYNDTDWTRYTWHGDDRLTGVIERDGKATKYRYNGDGELYEEVCTNPSQHIVPGAGRTLRYTQNVAQPLSDILVAD